VIVNDLVLFVFIFVFEITMFLLLNYALLRVYPRSGLLHSSAAAILLAVFIVTILSYLLISESFSTIGSYVVAVFGSGLSVIFAGLLYTFLGPATAERSLASHMLNLLYDIPGYSLTREEIFDRYDSKGFVQKRVDECMSENILEENNGTLVLTGKGRKIAGLYRYILNTLRLYERQGYRDYFRRDREV
jgi:hypothetical protein